MSRDRLFWLLLPGLALLAWVGIGIVLFVVTLPAEPAAALRADLAPLIESHWALAAGWLLAGTVAGAWVGSRLHSGFVASALRLADTTRTMVGAGSAPDAIPAGAAPIRTLAAAINGLAAERRALSANLGRHVADASRDMARQRDQLATLMAQLDQGVLVCNRDGRILLYNPRARAVLGGAAELVGLGRQVGAAIGPALFEHARETVTRRIARGDAEPTAQMVAAAEGGDLVRIRMAPVRSDAETGGYVLLLDDITAEHATEAHRDGLLLGLTEACRAGLAAMQAALDVLDLPDLSPDERARFLAVVRDEVSGLGARVDGVAGEAAAGRQGRWPLQEILGADLLSAAAQAIESATGQPAARGDAPALWLRLDSFAVVEALRFLADRVAQAGATGFGLRLAPTDGGRAHLDLTWSLDAGQATAALAGWQSASLGPAAGAATVRDVAERHGGEVWLEQDRGAGSAFIRLLLPLAPEVEATTMLPPARPTFYDFDLFALRESSSLLDDQPLGSLTYTVLDTETTGLNPADGDEIIQVGAARIVNGRIVDGESIDQLVDPGRSIPEAGIPIHGIRPEMVRGQPRIGEVLPRLAAFAADTVLVGHNVAFDMRFLALKEEATGVAFRQPVLDTLLLASVVTPHEEAHGLEQLAGRLGLTISGRHNAYGDAIATAEVFLRLLPLLAERGIVTLGEARAASATSRYARLRY